MSKPQTISACMMVKNEEAYIFDAVASVHEWVDEVIVIDTGSTDRTKEILEQFEKVKLFEEEWKNDFSYHRNRTIEKATSDWVFIIDADERVVPGHGENLVKMIQDIKEPIIAVDVVNLYQAEGSLQRVPRSKFKSLRFFHQSAEPKYEGRVHNQPVIKKGAKVCGVPFQINHFGYDLPQDEMDAKFQRTADLCREWVVDEPKNPKAYFHLAQVLRVKDGKFNEEAYPEIMAAVDKGLSLTLEGDYLTTRNMRAMLLNMGAWMSHLKGENEQAIKYAEEAINLIPYYLDAILVAGFAATYGVDALAGEKYLHLYLEERKKYLEKEVLDGITMEHINEKARVYGALRDVELWKERNGVQSAV